jgi:hypothetical protein
MRYILLLIATFSANLLFGQMKMWVEPSSIDTTLTFKNKTIELSPSTSSDFDPYFLSNELIKSLTKDFGNFHQKAMAIEEYQLKKFASIVKREGNELFVKLDDGRWFQLEINSDYDETAHAFEYYFDKFGFYSIRVQWGEGNGYKLVNSRTGEMTNLIGRPFFSPDGTQIVALGNDIEAGYSINGFQLLTNNSGTVKALGTFSPTSWGCESGKWLSNSRLILKNVSFEYSDSSSNYFNFFTELEIK